MQEEKKKDCTSLTHRFSCPLGNCIPYDVQMSNSFIGYTVATPSYRLTYHLMVHSAIHTHINKQIIWQDDLKHKTITCKRIQYSM